MAIAKMYGHYLEQAQSGEHDLLSDDIRVSLHSNSYTPDQDNHEYVDDLSAEISGTGYTAGGELLTSKTLTYTAATNEVVFDAADLQWENADFTMRHAVIYNDTPGTAATKGLMGYVDNQSDITVSGGDFDIVWDADGIQKVTVD